MVIYAKTEVNAKLFDYDLITTFPKAQTLAFMTVTMEQEAGSREDAKAQRATETRGSTLS
jgi:hypothetical protein